MPQVLSGQLRAKSEKGVKENEFAFQTSATQAKCKERKREREMWSDWLNLQVVSKSSSLLSSSTFKWKREGSAIECVFESSFPLLSSCHRILECVCVFFKSNRVSNWRRERDSLHPPPPPFQSVLQRKGGEGERRERWRWWWQRLSQISLERWDGYHKIQGGERETVWRSQKRGNETHGEREEEF